MFRQILIHPDDLNWQRLLWRDSPKEPIQDFQALTVTYGTACAPYLAIRSFLQLAENGQTSHPEAFFLLTNQTYADDVFLEADRPSEILAQRDQLINLLASAGMELGKWSSNNLTLLQRLSVESSLELPTHSGDTVSTLGLRWNPVADTFHFKATLPPIASIITKRSILSDTARLFNPLGFLAPILIRAKILLQDLWINRLEWDETVPRDLQDRWLTFRESLDHLTELQTTRWTGTSNDQEWHLHGFADASQRADAAVTYAVIPGKEPVLLMAKTRVVPVKIETVPRLELCAATLLVRLTKHLLSGLFHVPSSVHFWSDSKVALDWLGIHPSRWPTFIANRVSEINSTIPEATRRHIRSADNPADCASRGLSPRELVNLALWWRGPVRFADQPTDWPKPIVRAEPIQVGVVSEVARVPTEEFGELPMLESLSSFLKIVRVLAYCL